MEKYLNQQSVFEDGVNKVLVETIGGYVFQKFRYMIADVLDVEREVAKYLVFVLAFIAIGILYCEIILFLQRNFLSYERKTPSYRGSSLHRHFKYRNRTTVSTSPTTPKYLPVRTCRSISKGTNMDVIIIWNFYDGRA